MSPTGRTCLRPDRDEPRIVCGYPHPCPHHTVVMEAGAVTIPSDAVVNPRALDRLRQVARLFAGPVVVPDRWPTARMGPRVPA